MNKFLFQIVIISLLFVSNLVAAQTKHIAHNNDLWSTIYGNLKINEKWGTDLELHFRTANMGSDKQQILVRPSIYYMLNKNLSFNIGYTHIETYPYGEQAIAFQTPENNIWAQILLKQNISKINISHRYRYESRWIGNIALLNGIEYLEKYTHRNRFRYRLSLSRTIKTSKFSIKIFNELFINFDDEIVKNPLDQYWFFAGINYKINKIFGAGIGYMWQVINKSDGIRQE
ncbi:MAG: DUF2490 domain-containing protein, partial [Cyclobacteriaceae bacterium]|nr:DUF2490 domain-containing protein [Cyclobacteriaceae bacterium]